MQDGIKQDVAPITGKTASPRENGCGSNQLSPPLQVGKGDWAAVQVGEGAVWIIGLENGTIKRIDPRSNQVVAEFSGGPKQHNGIFSSPFKYGVYALCVGAGGLWVIDNKVLSSGAYTLNRIDPKTHDHVATIKVANGVGAPVFWKGFAWVPTLGYHLTGHSITKVDPATNKVGGEVSLSVVRGRTVLSDQGSRPPTLHADEDSLWAFSGGSLVRRIRLKN